jgi:hypothetical protein
MTAQTRPRDMSRSPVTLDDLTADLIWPRLLRSASLALGPSRMGIAFFAVILLALVGRFAAAIARWRGEGTEDITSPWQLPLSVFGTLMDAVLRRDDYEVGASLYRLFVWAPALSLAEFPVSTILSVVAGVLILAIAGGAICRMAACDFSLGLNIGWPQGIGFGLTRLGSLLGALIGPLAVVWVVALLIAVGGLVLRVPVLNVAGGLLYGIALLLAFLGVLIVIAYLVGHPLLIPAVACEGADAIDAIQRAYAYVYGRPLRLAWYAVVLILQSVVVFFLVRTIAWCLTAFAGHAFGAMAGESGNDVLRAVYTSQPESETAQKLGVGGAATASLVRLWLIVVWGLVAAYALSFYFCASTLLYLALRRVSDGQDMHELWLPGMVRGTLAEERDGSPSPTAVGPEGGLIE